jgi:mannosyl-oligosaccharide alpha-1,2-mannosidase
VCQPSFSFVRSLDETFALRHNGWSVTLFDSLDTMWIMGLKSEFQEALEDINDRRFDVRYSTSV